METSIITLKAYSIQALQTPTFDKLIILLGNFHHELAFFGAVGTFLADSGIEYLNTEANVLAEGSLDGFMNGNSITDVPKSIKFLLLLWKESFSLSIKLIQIMPSVDRPLVGTVKIVVCISHHNGSIS